MAVLLLLAIVTPLFSPFSRRVKDVHNSTSESSMPPVSIILTVHDNASQLEKVLDAYLNQDYEAYQIIVVIDEYDSASEDILKQRSSYPHLYYTKLPESSRYLSRKKLAITLGMRAAKHEWVIVTSVYCKPTHDKWLKAFAAYMDREHNMIMGVTPFEEDTPSSWRFQNLRMMLYDFQAAARKTAYSTNQSLVALKRNEFLAESGFAGNLQYQRAEFEFLVNKFAKPNKTALAISPDSWLEQCEPTKKQWMYRQMHAMDSVCDMKRRGSFGLICSLELLLNSLYNVLTVIVLCVTSICLYNNIASHNLVFEDVLRNSDTVSCLTILGLTLLFWILSYVESVIIFKRTIRYFGQASAWSAPIRQLFVLWKELTCRIQYMRTDKNDFRTHKV